MIYAGALVLILVAYLLGFYRVGHRKDGTLVVQDSEERVEYSFVVDLPLDKLPQRKRIVLNVRKEAKRLD